MSRFPSLFFVAALLLATHASAASLEGRVVGVSDGDTITVLDSANTQYKIRLLGIDAPEKKQPFGQVSKQSLSDMVYNKTVRVDWEKKDHYKRVLGKVFVGSSDTNVEQIKRGLAWHYTKYQKQQPLEDRYTYSAAEAQAKQERVGLWKDPTQTPPWEWRRTKKKLP